jgi:hypothetical protein
VTARSDRPWRPSNLLDGENGANGSVSGSQSTPSSVPATNGQTNAVQLPVKSAASVSASDEDVIETMVSAGEYDSPHTSSFERYRGSFAGLSLLRRVHNLCKDVSARRKNSDVEALQDDFIHAFDFASPNNDSAIPWDSFAMLPPRANLHQAIDIVVNQACCNLQFLGKTQSNTCEEKLIRIATNRLPNAPAYCVAGIR